MTRRYANTPRPRRLGPRPITQAQIKRRAEREAAGRAGMTGTPKADRR